MKNGKRILTVLLSAVLAAAMFLTGCGKQKSVMEKYEGKLAVTIDDKKVMLSDMMYQLFGAEINGSYYDTVYQTYYGMSFWDMEEDGRTMRQYLKDEAMNTAVMYQIMAMEAEKANLVLTDEETAEYQGQIDELLNQEDEDAVKTIEYVGFTRDNLEAQFKVIALAMKYYDELAKDFGIDEETVKAGMDYEDYREYVTEYLYLATSTLDADNNLVEQTEEEKAAAKANMEEALAMAEKGDAFSDIVTAMKDKEVTLSSSTRTLTRGTESVDEDYRNAALALEKGGMSGIVESGNGYYIIKMTDDNSSAGFDTAVQEAVDAAVSEAFTQKYEEIKAGYTITVNNDVWDGLNFGEITLEPVPATTAAK